MSDRTHATLQRVLTVARSKKVRELCLAMLDEARPEIVTDEALMAVMRRVYHDASLIEVRRELDYLSMKSLISALKDRHHWHVKLTWQGIDHVDSTWVRGLR